MAFLLLKYHLKRTSLIGTLQCARIEIHQEFRHATEYIHSPLSCGSPHITSRRPKTIGEFIRTAVFKSNVPVGIF
jgi:hypothetical protein